MSQKLIDSLNYSPVELGFGTSGLRGLATEMTDLECYINTLGFLNFAISIGNIKAGSAVALAGDLRESTPRILNAVASGIVDAGLTIAYLGQVPTPAAAYFGMRHDMPVIMVTGSHIPADRNGIKFYKHDGEVLKDDETAIKRAVASIRQEIYSQPVNMKFNEHGAILSQASLPAINQSARQDFLERYSSLFPGHPLQNKKIVVYQHSSVAAEMLVELCEELGAEVLAVDKADKFIPIDTENVTSENRAYFKSLARKYPNNFAIISADGDADRPFVVDESGTFQRGDILGAITTEFLKADSAAVPISASDAVDEYLKMLGINLVHTKIGSPYVISAMEEQVRNGQTKVVGWEVNGGFLTGSELSIGDHRLTALPTRDAFLPIVCALMAAIQKKCKLSALFAALPPRFTQAGLLDNFPIAISQAILKNYSDNAPDSRQKLEEFFTPWDGFGRIVNINAQDGIRITFDNSDIAHIRPSGNAPQLRIYSIADSQKRADEMVSLALAEPNGILRRLEQKVSTD
jgi:phosphomannomutase